MFTDKFGGIELPHPPNIKIEENPNLFATYTILEKKYKNYTSFCILSIAERIICSIKCIFDEILGKFWLLKIILGFWDQISRLLVGRLNSERNLESNY